MKTIAVINAKASRSRLDEDGYKKLFKAEGVELTKLILISDPKKLTSAFEKVIKMKPEVVIVGGGDGTIIGFADSAQKLSYTGNIVLLPVGTANYLARNLRIPLDIKEAVSVIKHGKVKRINLPRANAVLFSLFCSVGVIAAASGSVSVKLKRQTGQLAYVIESLKQLVRHKSFAYTVTAKDGRRLSGRSHQLMVVNADLSHQFDVIPDSKLTKPHMTLTIFESKSSRLRLLFSVLVYILSLGKFRMGLKIIEDTEFTIETNPNNEVSVDGEVSFKTPVKVTAQGSQINVLCPTV